MNAGVLANWGIPGFELVSGCFDHLSFVLNLISEEIKRATACSSLTMATPMSRCSEAGPEESVSQGFTGPSEIDFHNYDEVEEDRATYSIPDTHDSYVASDFRSAPIRSDPITDPYKSRSNRIGKL